MAETQDRLAAVAYPTLVAAVEEEVTRQRAAVVAAALS
jgi:hypothetical protein